MNRLHRGGWIGAVADAVRSRRQRVERKVVRRYFNIDELGVARAEVAQFMAYGSGIAFLVEKILPLAVVSPPVVASTKVTAVQRRGLECRLRGEAVMGWTPPRRPWCARVVVFGHH